MKEREVEVILVQLLVLEMVVVEERVRAGWWWQIISQRERVLGYLLQGLPEMNSRATKTTH